MCVVVFTHELQTVCGELGPLSSLFRHAARSRSVSMSEHVVLSRGLAWVKRPGGAHIAGSVIKNQFSCYSLNLSDDFAAATH